MVRGETVARRMRGDVRDAQRTTLRDDQSEQPVTLRRGTKATSLFVGDAARDEPLDVASIVGEDAQCGVARANERAHSIDDELEHAFDFQHAGHGPDRVTQCLDRGTAGPVTSAAYQALDA